MHQFQKHTDSPVIEPSVLDESQVPQTNGSKHNNMPPTRREPPALRQDNLTDAMAVLVQSMAEEREERREQRAITQALIAKLANGDGKAKGIIQAAGVVITIVLAVGFYVVSLTSNITSNNRDLVKDVQFLTQRDADRLEYIKRLEDRLTLSEVNTQTLREDLYRRGVLTESTTRKR